MSALQSIQWIKNRPFFFSTLVALAFYLYRTSYLPVHYSIVITIPVVMIFYLSSRIFYLILAKRLGQDRPLLWIELAFAASILIALYFLEFSKLPYWVNLSLPFIFIWLTILIIQKNTGTFYAIFSGVLFFVFILVSFRIIHLEERWLLKFHRQYVLGEKPVETSWKNHEKEKKIKVLYFKEIPIAEFVLPESMQLHDSISENPFAEGFRTQSSGIISSGSSAMVPPLLMVYILPQAGDMNRLRADMDMNLGMLAGSGRVYDVEFSKETQLGPPAAGVYLKGLTWSMKETASGNLYRTTLYLVEGDLTMMFVITEGVVPGLPHTHEVLDLLRGIRLLSGQKI